MTELLSSLIDFGKYALSAAKEARASHTWQKNELLYDFILEAIGPQNCLMPDTHESGTVSFATVDRRLLLLQENEPDRAHECGMPAVNNPKREECIRKILGEMVRAGKIKRSRVADRWQF